MLAAGAGTRLRPLTDLRPKALCPVGDRPLIEHALERLDHILGSRACAYASTTPQDESGVVAVNVHHHRDQLVAHLDGRVHLSIEDPVALGTAGALANLRDWIDGRDVVVLNADGWHAAALAGVIDGWDHQRVRLLCVEDPARGDFGTLHYTGAGLLPWPVVRDLPAGPIGLYEACFGPARDTGALDLVTAYGPFFDCGTPANYLAANLSWSDGANVVGEGAVVEGVIERTVVWPGARVEAHEVLRDAVRADGGVTVQVT